MEGDKFLMAAGVTAAFVVGAFVFWGPSGTARLRSKKGQIAGLHNFGRTCFLNTLLQALAACPQFIAWLQLNNSNTNNKKGLIASLLTTLEVINGTHPTLREDPYSPGCVLRALYNSGWVIPPDEHDAHELFYALLSSVDTEATKPKKIGCLSDALEEFEPKKPVTKTDMPPPRPSSAMLSDFLNTEYDESTNLNRQTRSEAHTPDSPISTCTNADDSADTTLIEETLASPGTNIGSFRSSRPRTSSYSQFGNGELNKRTSVSCRSLERLSRGPGRISVWSQKASFQVPHPFRGALSSQMACTGCGHKQPVRYDKFDSISLPLPESKNQGLSLAVLLSDFVATENFSGVQCETCSEKTTQSKSVTFAKLPSCLCIHIVRTIWLQSGQICKRQDFVHFPESLSMAQYSFIQPRLNSQASTPWGSTFSLLASSMPNTQDTFGTYTFGSMLPRNLYRLLAVVVHSGEAESGHFVTYRRGALRNSHKWYYTSDTIVREVGIEEVLSVPAYMLFYDRGPQRLG